MSTIIILLLLLLASPLRAANVNAHGGCILRADSLYYWYGEHRPYTGFTTQVGVSVYTSRDLTSWREGGVALAVSEEAGSPIERGCIIERPKVVFCPKTRQWVMLFHLERKGRGYEAAQVGFAVSDRPEGPFRFLRALRPGAGKWPREFTKKDIKAARALRPDDYKEWWTPAWREAIAKGLFTARDFAGGQMSRDMTVFVDRDGRAYLITSSEDNLTLHIHALTPDYLDFTGEYTRVAPAGQNEAPTIMRRADTYYLITSGCTGWAPNEARLFTAPSIWGPWTQHPTPFQGPDAPKTFGGQGTYIHDLPSAPLLFMADIWHPDHLAESEHLWRPITFGPDSLPIITQGENLFRP